MRGLCQLRSVGEGGNGFPLFGGDAGEQRVVEAVDQVDGLVEGIVTRDEESERVEFKWAAGLDCADCFAREVEGFAAKTVHGRLDAIADVADTDSNAERKRVK